MTEIYIITIFVVILSLRYFFVSAEKSKRNKAKDAYTGELIKNKKQEDAKDALEKGDF